MEFISDRTNRVYFICSIIVSVILSVLLKHFYPFPQLIFDSYNYLQAAAYHWDFNAWPIGYSKFLQLFGLFCHSAMALVCFQYLFLQMSLCYFFFTWTYFFNPNKYVRFIVFVFFNLNPLFLFCSNFIISDSLFIGLSILWITQLLWIICQPRLYMIFLQTLLLTLAFTVRYSALYYPVVATLALLISRQSTIRKVVGIGLSFVLPGVFVFFTSSRIGAVSGENQFSPFGAWKLANDAIYIYGNVPRELKRPVPVGFRSLDGKVREFLDSSPFELSVTTDDFTSGSLYMFYRGSPLVQYMDSVYGDSFPFLNTKKWLVVAPFYEKYGLFLIRNYPGYFVQYFLWPNFHRYFLPPREIFGSDNSFAMIRTYWPLASRWFNIPTLLASRKQVSVYLAIMKPFPSIFMLGHLIFLGGFCGFVFWGGFKKLQRPYSDCLWVIFGLWLIDFAFNLFAAAIVIRYQMFIMIPEIAFGSYYISFTISRRRPVSLPAGQAEGQV